MSRLMNRLTSGRWKLWWMRHGREFWYYVAMLAVFALYCVASTMDYRDQIRYERERANVHQSRAEMCEQGPKLPKTVFVIESSSTFEAQEKLAGIAGAVDGFRAKLWSNK